MKVDNIDYKPKGQCEKWCGLNHCDENGCNERERVYVKNNHWLKSKAINKAYIAELLYGKNTAVTRSKLNQKIRGEKNFTASELEKLKEIKQLISKQLLE